MARSAESQRRPALRHDARLLDRDAAPPANPLSTVKVKINGRCMNSCRFCTFHGRSETLEVEHLERVLAALPEGWTGQVLVNGGEPTLHPRFVEMAERLGTLRPGCRVGVGTNLRLFERGTEGPHRTSRIEACWDALLRCFDLVQVGCDDEHRNIDVVERLVPLLRHNGIDVYLNCMAEFASERTRTRLRALDATTGSSTRLCSVTPRTRSATPVASADEGALCVKRGRELLVDCDGAIYFCFNQELEVPVANLHRTGDTALRALARTYVPPAPFRACSSCSRFVPAV